MDLMMIDGYGPGCATEHIGAIRGLLLCTRHPQKWRDALKHFLTDYIMEQPMKDALSFITNVIGQARSEKLRSAGAWPHLVRVDPDSKPRVFPLDRWRRLMITLGFMLEEPDLNRDLGLCSVYVHDSVRLPLLTGILTLLNCLSGLTVHVIRWLLQMSQVNALLLLSAVTCTLAGGHEARLTRVLGPLWEQYGDLLETVGYRRITHRQHVHYTYIMSTPPGVATSTNNSSLYPMTYGHRGKQEKGYRADTELLSRVQAVLLAMYGTLTDVVQETSV